MGYEKKMTSENRAEKEERKDKGQMGETRSHQNKKGRRNFKAHVIKNLKCYKVKSDEN